MDKRVTILWRSAPERGEIEIVHGRLARLQASSGNGSVDGKRFNFPGGRGALEIRISRAMIGPGAFATIVRVKTGENSFSFFLRDALDIDNPVWIPEYEVAVIPSGDKRNYERVVRDIGKRGIISDFMRFEREPEEDFESAAARNRNQYCPTWLGISRDMRIFRFGYQEQYGYFGKIVPCYHSFRNEILGNSDIFFAIGQGASCRVEIKRRLEDGCLPILRARQTEQFMHYDITAFASLEKQPFSMESVRGSHYLAAYANSHGNMLGENERRSIRTLLDREMHKREQEVILCCRVDAVNSGKAPCYAWFKTPYGGDWRFNGEKGFTVMDKKVVAITRLNGKPLPQEEIAVLVQPGNRAVFEIIVPHSPIAEKRALRLLRLNLDAHLKAATRYWRTKLKSAAVFNLPEKQIDHAVRAGLLHCDLVAIGKEPEEPVAATIGWYSPIGTESSPIIQYFDSVGWHKLAERSLQFFFERQRKDGFIQNFANYESETGPFLWTVGEHFRYTGDTEWLKRVMPKIRKSVTYILRWRERNKKDSCREKGYYGMVDGKVADPEDYYHSFFLNAGSYIGLKRIAEITGNLCPEYSAKLKREVEEYRQDIRDAFYRAMARAPVAPCGDGSWAPLMPPWVEYNGAVSLYADGGRWFTHGSFTIRDSAIGPLWLIIGEVISPQETGATFMLKSNQFPLTRENASLSQPYYCRHDFAHIKRGEVRAFLKCYYNQLTGLMDRETCTFWEHYYGASQHKTHEEAWFLMQTRWMLYMEEGDAIDIFPAAPDRWFEDGKEIQVKNAASYFGRISIKSVSELRTKKRITVCFECHGRIVPRSVRIRIPHPRGLVPLRVEGADYSADGKKVLIRPFEGKCSARFFY